jgi:hypothetical protein
LIFISSQSVPKASLPKNDLSFCKSQPTQSTSIKMPYMTVIIPQVTNEHKDAFLGSWGTISKEMKDLPFVLGVSGGEIVAQDGALVTDFKFLQTMGMSFVPAEFAGWLTRPSICNTRRRGSIKNI